jgi:sugar fermentation stimulation protein A
VEMKNVTYREGDRALFPDAVTDRGAKHLAELLREIALDESRIDRKLPAILV